MTHFVDFEQFSAAVASDGFFAVRTTLKLCKVTVLQDKEGNAPISKALNTARKHSLLVGKEVHFVLVKGFSHVPVGNVCCASRSRLACAQ